MIKVRCGVCRYAARGETIAEAEAALQVQHRCKVLEKRDDDRRVGYWSRGSRWNI